MAGAVHTASLLSSARSCGSRSAGRGTRACALVSQSVVGAADWFADRLRAKTARLLTRPLCLTSRPTTGKVSVVPTAEVVASSCSCLPVARPLELAPHHAGATLYACPTRKAGPLPLGFADSPPRFSALLKDAAREYLSPLRVGVAARVRAASKGLLRLDLPMRSTAWTEARSFGKSGVCHCQARRPLRSGAMANTRAVSSPARCSLQGQACSKETH